MEWPSVFTALLSFLSAALGAGVSIGVQFAIQRHERKMRANERRIAVRKERKRVLDLLLDELDSLETSAARIDEPEYDMYDPGREVEIRNRIERLALQTGSVEVVHSFIGDSLDIDRVGEPRKVVMVEYAKLIGEDAA